MGGVHYPDEGRVDPKRFVDTVGRAAADLGVDIQTGREVRSLDELQAETVVVAAGVWSGSLVDLPLEGGKGYHVDYEYTEGDPRLPAIGRLGGAVVATGHAMKGVSLAPITGRLVAQVVAGEPPEIDLAPFDPARF